MPLLSFLAMFKKRSTLRLACRDEDGDVADLRRELTEGADGEAGLAP